MTHSILYAWELGANLGHVGPFLPIARRLREKGHMLTMAIPSHSTAVHLLDAERIPYVIIPSHPYEKRNAVPLNYADMLSRFGYANNASLLKQTSAWRALMQEVKPDIVLIDHAPTAILAARTLQLKAMFFSTGFNVPPQQFPTPSLLPSLPISKQQLGAVERPVVASINSVLAHYGQAPIKGVGQLFNITENSLLGLPVLDHYPQRFGAQYWGSLPEAGSGPTPMWPDIPGKRLFAYLRADNPQFESICSVLRSSCLPSLVFCPDGQHSELARTPASHISVTHSPVNLTCAVHEADVAITYGNFWTTTSFLLAGKPILILPVYIEQDLLAQRLASLGAAEVSKPDSTKSDLQSRLERLLMDPSYSENAQQFKRDYADYTPEQTVERIVQRIEELAES